MNAFEVANRFVIGEGETRDELQVSGRWIATRDPVDVGANA